MRSNACDTLTRSCARHVLCWPALPLAPVLGSTGSATDHSALFVGFVATTTESDFSGSCIIGFDSSSSRCGPGGVRPQAKPETSRFPYKELPHMPGSSTTPGWAAARTNALVHVAFRVSDHVGARYIESFAAPWLAYVLPYRRFDTALAVCVARLGVDAVCYSFIVADFHPLLLAGFAGAPEALKAELRARLAECHLELHPTKTKMVSLSIVRKLLTRWLAVK